MLAFDDFYGSFFKTQNWITEEKNKPKLILNSHYMIISAVTL